ncbi:surfeit locus 1 family protein [Variovorax beijingensis]|uniref:SURF1-like protein n=2 Tax=Variovorax TaxID=34072 RepID=A0AAE3XZB0_VARPD|nr:MULTISPECIES: SURF1 family protein [Variovorax]MDR6426473.1 surfeit locus 1 family protein [Variovorax paradoxus]TWD78656.1 surfeit locus 1 family protein [Variovorax beijingensis]
MTPPPPEPSTHDATPAGRPRGAAARVALAVCAALAFAGFFALGTWQVERRAWKLDLIARVEQRVHAPASEAPGRERWPQVNAADDEYRRVRIAGRFLHGKETLVQASTRLGAGFWVLTPLQAADGSIVLVNRGFVPPEARERTARAANEPQGETTVTGLLRISEPKGGFLRRNEPAADRWFSRDVQAIAAARGLHDAAPYFVDAEAAPSPPGAAPAWPAAGLTVIAFPNSHLVYAITWYGLALMVLGAAWFGWREGRRRAGGADGGTGENTAHADATARPDARRD